MAGVINEEEDNIEYDEDGNPIMPDKKVTLALTKISICDDFHIVYVLNLVASKTKLFFFLLSTDGFAVV